MQFIKDHFRRYLQRQPWDFCWRIAVESLVVGVIISALLSGLGVPERELPDWNIVEMFIAIILVAPPLETLLFQALPIFIARKLKVSFAKQVITGTLVFGIFHIAEGVVGFIAAGLVGGFYFSFAYAHWRTKSRWQAFWVTTVSHAIHNAVAFVAIALLLTLE